MSLSPGVERALMNIAQELPRLTMEVEKLNKALAAPAEMKNSLIESLKAFRADLLNTIKEPKLETDKP
jgi:hypothetical protein